MEGLPGPVEGPVHLVPLQVVLGPQGLVVQQLEEWALDPATRSSKCAIVTVCLAIGMIGAAFAGVPGRCRWTSLQSGNGNNIPSLGPKAQPPSTDVMNLGDVVLVNGDIGILVDGVPVIVRKHFFSDTLVRIGSRQEISGLSGSLIGAEYGVLIEVTLPHEEAFGSLGWHGVIPPHASVYLRIRASEVQTIAAEDPVLDRPPTPRLERRRHPGDPDEYRALRASAIKLLDSVNANTGEDGLLGAAEERLTPRIELTALFILGAVMQGPVGKHFESGIKTAAIALSAQVLRILQEQEGAMDHQSLVLLALTDAYSTTKHPTVKRALTELFQLAPLRLKRIVDTMATDHACEEIAMIALAAGIGEQRIRGAEALSALAYQWSESSLALENRYENECCFAAAKVVAMAAGHPLTIGEPDALRCLERLTFRRLCQTQHALVSVDMIMFIGAVASWDMGAPVWTHWQDAFLTAASDICSKDNQAPHSEAREALLRVIVLSSPWGYQGN